MPIPTNEAEQPTPIHEGDPTAPAPIRQSPATLLPRSQSIIKPAPQAIAPSVESITPTASPETTKPQGGKADDVATEVVTERYPNRMIKIERHVTQDSERNFTNHGPWIMYAPDGTLIAKGRFEFGRRQGEWQRLYDAKDERVVGKFGKQFTPPFIGIAQFVDHKLHGTWKIVDAQQREIRSWEFKHGQLDGTAVSYYPSGKKQSEMAFDNGILSGSVLEWDSIGNVTKRTDYKDGRSTTPYAKKYPNGRRHHEGQYLGPKQIVKTNVDFWTGVVELQVARTEGSAKRHGKWIEYYEHGGKKFEGEFDEDQPLGVHVWWHSNGQKMAEGRFDGGKAHGHWLWWHANGLKQKDGNFEHGVQSGTWVHWKADGKVQEVQEHSLQQISPQQAKPLVNASELQDDQPSEPVSTESAPPVTSTPPVRRLSPVPMQQQRSPSAPRLRNR
jgi:antitoxin component YwqK of YwqJK toxin-antitoxin module